MRCGACNAVRGSVTAADSELGFILSSSGAVGVVCDDAATLRRLAPQLGSLDATQPGRVRFVVLLWGDVNDALAQEVWVWPWNSVCTTLTSAQTPALSCVCYDVPYSELSTTSLVD